MASSLFYADVDLVDSLALSEIYTLKAMIYVGKIFINPMVNGMKYGPLSGQSIEQAIKYYPNNPRPYYLDGQSKFSLLRFLTNFSPKVNCHFVFHPI